MLTEKELERHKRYKKEHRDRYNYSWNKAHKESRKILLNSWKDSEICYLCSKSRKTRCHHVDRNPYNNSIDNLEWCCYSCDSKQNYRKYMKD